MKRLPLVMLILLLMSCGAVKPGNGTVHATGTVTGTWSEKIVGIRLVASLPGIMNISEAVTWADDGLRSSHSARGDTTTIRTTFTLPADDYWISIEALRQESPGAEVTTHGMNPRGSEWIRLFEGKVKYIELTGNLPDW